ncbi:MAG: M48 family metallopeptidase [Gammaproteobacteria bacterium]|nr:M48 family metallopeptidase [Gammaproteobacteria bacterium]
MKFLPQLLFALTLTFGTVWATTTQDLPDIGDSAGSVVSPEYEQRLGQAVMRQVRQHANIIQDPEVESYIQSIGYQLAANSDNSQIPFNFFVMNDPVINAFAAPGGVVGINSGVILNSNTESELAGVMAHEVAHVTQRHMARTFEKASQLSLPMAATIVGAILLGVANPEAGQAALAIATGVSAQYQINFTRANEEEADRVGMQLLARSGFDPHGMPAFFERLQQVTRYSAGNAPEFLRTHPLTESRIADTRARADQYPPGEYKSSTNFKLTRAKLQVISHNRPNDAVKLFEQQLSSDEYPDKTSARYGYVLALTAAENFSKAREQVHILLNDDRENIAFLLAAARLESAQRNFPAAVGIYREAQRLYPDYRPLVMGYARALLDAKEPLEARDLLRKYGQDHEQDLAYYDLLSQAEAETGSPAESGIAKAEYYYLSGDTQLAIDRLKFAQRQTELNYYQQERISARLSQLEYELELEKELEL